MGGIADAEGKARLRRLDAEAPAVSQAVSQAFGPTLLWALRAVLKLSPAAPGLFPFSPFSLPFPPPPPPSPLPHPHPVPPPHPHPNAGHGVKRVTVFLGYFSAK
jgi:hypothetical protein